jgi:hypothetical protein
MSSVFCTNLLYDELLFVKNDKVRFELHFKLR